MKFSIITHAVHKEKDSCIYAYEPYVKEMNLWLKYVDEVQIVAPVSTEKICAIDSDYQTKWQIPNQVGNDDSKRHSAPDAESHEIEQDSEMLKQVQHDGEERHSQLDWESHDSQQKGRTPNKVGNDGIQLIKIPSFDITSLKNSIKALIKIPRIGYQIYKAMQWADHIHLRCPGNVGLLGCFVQILFSKKPKTVKYAGNWDPTSKQPISYRLQKWILSNTFLTRNCKVLVYGDWPNQSENIVPFFTASYSEEEIEEVQIRDISIVKKQIAMSRTLRNDESIEEGQMLNQVQHDGIQRHSALDAESHDLENDQQIATSHTPRNDESEGEQMLNQVQHDEIQRHPQLDWGSHELENDQQIAASRTPRNDESVEEGQMLNQVQHDDSKRHSALDAESVTNKLKFIYVGGLTPGKQPLLSVQVVHELKRKGYNVQLDMYGDGVEKAKITDYILDNSLEGIIILHGNTSKEIVKKAYQQAHFLLFISKSEGWPKVVAEAMFWGCVPLTSAVSCVPEMLGNGSRGAIVVANLHEIVSVIEKYIVDVEIYNLHAKNAMEWSRQFILEKFEEEIGRLLV